MFVFLLPLQYAVTLIVLKQKGSAANFLVTSFIGKGKTHLNTMMITTLLNNLKAHRSYHYHKGYKADFGSSYQ